VGDVENSLFNNWCPYGKRVRVRGILFIVLLLLFFSACDHDDPQYSVPDFTLPDVYGNEVNLYGYLSQSPVVIIPWAMWCKMSIEELDALLLYGDTLHSIRVTVFAISQDGSQYASQVTDTAFEHDWVYEYEILLDTANIIRDLYDIQAMPSTIAIDMSGDIVYRHEGYKTGDEIIIVDTLKAIFGD
jgi:peroxiredoxin